MFFEQWIKRAILAVLSKVDVDAILYHPSKEEILSSLEFGNQEIYHQADGVCEHTSIRIYLQRQSILICNNYQTQLEAK